MILAFGGRSMWAIAALMMLASGSAKAQQHGDPAKPPVFVADGGTLKVDALDWKESPAFVSIYEKWELDESSRLGRKSRPKAASQGMLPACFATAASQALDMKLCVDAKGKARASCSSMPMDKRVSSLWLSKVGGNIDGSSPEGLEMPEGGSSLGALRYALDRSVAPSESDCTWPNDDPKGISVERQREGEAWLARARESKTAQMEWVAKDGSDSYMAKYFRAQWVKSVARAFPQLNGRLEALADAPSHAQAIGEALWRPGCERPKVALPTGARAASIPSAKNMDENLKLLSGLLASGREPIIAMCLDERVPELWHQCKLRHGMLVIGLAKFKGQGGPKDFGWGLWTLNSWGERWQDASADGWIRSEPLMHRMQGDVVWVEMPGQQPFPGATVWPTEKKLKTKARAAVSVVESLGHGPSPH